MTRKSFFVHTGGDVTEKTLFFLTMNLGVSKYTQLPKQAWDKRGGCDFLLEGDKVMMHTFPPLADTALTVY